MAGASDWLIVSWTQEVDGTAIEKMFFIVNVAIICIAVYKGKDNAGWSSFLTCVFEVACLLPKRVSGHTSTGPFLSG